MNLLTEQKQTSKTKLRLPKGKWGGGGDNKLGVWDYMIINQQGPTV